MTFRMGTVPVGAQRICHSHQATRRKNIHILWASVPPQDPTGWVRSLPGTLLRWRLFQHPQQKSQIGIEPELSMDSKDARRNSMFPTPWSISIIKVKFRQDQVRGSHWPRPCHLAQPKHKLIRWNGSWSTLVSQSSCLTLVKLNLETVEKFRLPLQSLVLVRNDLWIFCDFIYYK